MPYSRRAQVGLLTILIAFGLLIGLIAWTGWTPVMQALGQVSMQDFAVAFVLSAVGVGLRFLRWRFYLLVLDGYAPIRQSLVIFFAGWALAPTPGNAGLAVRSVLLKRLGVSYSKSLAAFLAERFADVIGLLAITAVTAGLFPLVPQVLPLALLLLAGGFWLLTHRPLLKGWGNWLTGRPGAASRLLAGTLQCALDAGKCLQPGIALVGIIVGMLANLANAFALYYVLTHIGLEPSLLEAVFAYAAGIVAGVASLTPAGIGTTEATTSLLLVIGGLPEAGAVAGVLATRVASLWTWVAIGMLAWAYIGWRWREFGTARPVCGHTFNPLRRLRP